jgi:hypothetical protein
MKLWVTPGYSLKTPYDIYCMLPSIQIPDPPCFDAKTLLDSLFLSSVMYIAESTTFWSESTWTHLSIHSFIQHCLWSSHCEGGGLAQWGNGQVWKKLHVVLKISREMLRVHETDLGPDLVWESGAASFRRRCLSSDLKYVQGLLGEGSWECWVPVAHACNPSYSGGRDQEDLGLKPAQANSSWDPISRKPIIIKGLVEWLKV